MLYRLGVSLLVLVARAMAFPHSTHFANYWFYGSFRKSQ